MNANKVTVAMLKAAGFKAVDGDIINGVVFNEYQAMAANSTTSECGFSIVNDLVNRKNRGTQPVGDDCVVEVVGNNGNISVERAINVPWFKTVDKSQNGAVYAVVSWAPHLPSILEKQMNDKQESAINMSERDIEDAFIQQENAAVCRELAECDEWVNGDACRIDSLDGRELIFIGDVNHNFVTCNDCVVYDMAAQSPAMVKKSRLTKPLTPEQLAAKEREDAIDRMYAIFMSDLSVTARDGIAAIYDEVTANE